MMILTKTPGWTLVVLNDAFGIYTHNGSPVAVQLRGHTFRAELSEYRDRSRLFDLLGRDLYERAHVKPQSWFDDLVFHICPPLPIELDSEWAPDLAAVAAGERDK